MKKIFMGVVLFFSSFCAFSGDVASFVDIGFSEDGKTYVFGEYGVTDEKYQSYAEIYTVDMEQNDFVKGGIFKTEPSKSTFSKSGRDTFENLYSKAKWWLGKYNCRRNSQEHLIYSSDGKTLEDSEIVFRDVEGSTVERSIFYHIKLVKSLEKTSEEMKSSFFITLEKTDENGHTISRNIIGSPDIKRKNVISYKIEKIYSDKSNRNLIFVIEKTIADSTGTSIRYMVEAVRF